MTALELEGVGKKFAGVRALHDVSFSVKSGEILGIIGPNGAGKTTLFNVISGAVRPDVGCVRAFGTDITGWPAYRVSRCGLARTFQLTRPFSSMSVRDNVMVAAFARHRDRGAAEKAAQLALERTGLTAVADSRAVTLPTGGRKRLELARALALEPPVLLLDEVLAGVVPAEREPMLRLLAALRDDGVTLLFVEHVMAAVMSLSDRVLVLHHGEVLALGTPQEVSNDPTVVEAYLGERPLDAVG